VRSKRRKNTGAIHPKFASKLRKKHFADRRRKLTVAGGNIHLDATLEPAQSAQ
jgi:hypothetical protein